MANRYNRRFIEFNGANEMGLRWLAPLLLGLVLIGCGQKGDLYMPTEQTEQQQQ